MRTRRTLRRQLQAGAMLGRPLTSARRLSLALWLAGATGVIYFLAFAVLISNLRVFRLYFTIQVPGSVPSTEVIPLSMPAGQPIDSYITY